MIKLGKSAKPKILCTHSSKWLDIYILDLSKGINTKYSGKKYQHEEIKIALKNETHSKCAYCESKFEHVEYGHIDHIKPKSKYPSEIYEWENLTLACTNCNTRKSDYYSAENPMINPYTDDISLHLKAVGPLITAATVYSFGRTTIKVLDLNRAPLLLKRAEKIKNLENLIELWEKESDQNVKLVLEQELRREALEDAEFSFIVKSFLLIKGVNF